MSVLGASYLGETYLGSIGDTPEEKVSEHLVNLSQTTLTRSIGIISPETEQYISVSTASKFPTKGTFRVNLGGGELALVINVDGLVWTVRRGIEGTIPIAHQAGQLVTGVLTAGAVYKVIEESSDAGGVATEKARAEGAETVLTTNLAAESATRASADSSLAASVTAEKGRAEGVESTKASTSALTAETTARESADTTNATAILTEKTRAETAEGLKAAKAENLKDLASAATARTNLGLGTAATEPSTAFDAKGAAATAQAAAEAKSDIKGEAAAEKTRAEGVEATKAPLASPALTGTPTVPTATAGTNTTQAASTAFAATTKTEAESAATTAVGTEKTRAETAESLRISAASTASAAGQIPISESTTRATKWQSKLVIDARDYGVTVNEGTDATTALQNAINAASTAKGAVEMPAGIIRLASALTIKSNVELRGQGAMTLLEPVYAEANHAAVITNELETGNSNITLRNFRLTRAGTNVQHGILLNGVSNLNVDGVEIVGVPSVTSGALAVSGVLPGGSGATLQVSKDVRVRGCLFESANNFGVQLSYVTNATITGCVFDNCYREAVGVEPQTGCTATNISITGNTFTTGTVPSGGSATGVIVVTTSSGGTLAGVNVSGNTLTNTIFTATNTQPGINVLGINGDSKVTITGNMIVGMNGNGISVGNASIATGGVVISGNYISQCNEGKSIEFSGAGISLRQAFRCTITGNYIDGNHHTASIYESQSGAGRNLIIANHLLDTVAMTLLASGNTIARDNYGKATGSGGRLPVAANYTMLVTDTLIAVTSTSAAREITGLAANAVPAGVIYTITDESNGAATNNIIFKCAGSDTFTDGTKEKVINKNNGSLKFYSTGTSWQLSTGETPSAELESGKLKKSQVPSYLISSTAVIDMNRTWGAKPGIDNTKLIEEALAGAITEGKNVIDLYFGEPGVYPIEGAVKEGEAFKTKYAGQILLPARSATEGRITIKFSGPIAPAQPWFFSNNEPSANAPGVVLKSTATTGYVIDVIPGLEVTAPTIKGFSDLLVCFQNIIIQCPDNPQCGGVNAANALQFVSQNFSVEVAPTNEGPNTYPTGTRFGIILPHTGNKGLIHCYDTYIYGFPVGLGYYEHSVLNGVIIQRCAVGMEGLGQGHMNRYVYVDIERCPVGLKVKNEGECGGNIEGILDWENEEGAGVWETKYLIDEEYSARLRGKLLVFPFSKNTRGFPCRVAPSALNLGNPYYGGIGHRESLPLDECTRIANVAGNLGTCDQSVHPWFTLGGKLTTENGALLSEEAAGISRAVVNYKKPGPGTRTVSATIETRASGTYNIGLLLASVISGAKESNNMNVHLSGGTITLQKEVSGVRTELGKGGTVENGKTYELTAKVSYTAPGGTPTKVQVWLAKVLIIAYTLSTADREALEDTQTLLVRDGIRITEDIVSKVKRFQCTVDTAAGIPLETGRSAEMVAGKITIAAPATTATGAITIAPEGATMTVAAAIIERTAGTGFKVEAAATSTDRINWAVFAE
jgi:hypothetical protein